MDAISSRLACHDTDRVSRCLCCAGALLYDARELFDQQNAKADEGLRSIVQWLPEAVATCVDAALAELDEPRQIALMKVQTPPKKGHHPTCGIFQN